MNSIVFLNEIFCFLEPESQFDSYLTGPVAATVTTGNSSTTTTATNSTTSLAVTTVGASTLSK